MTARLRHTEFCTNLRLRMATRRLTQRYDAALADHGITVPQFSLLAALAREPDQSITDLARTLRIERTAVSRNLDLLARQELVRIEPAAAGNVRIVNLAERGHAKLLEAYPAWEQTQNDVKGQLGSRKWKQLLRLLGELDAI